MTLIGFAVGGEAGRKLAEGMKLSASPDTLLRLIRATPDTPLPTPRILGVDDFAFRRRRTYGTILIDLEKRLPVDLLPDREAGSLARWLLAHSGVELVSRDRGGDYAKGMWIPKGSCSDFQEVLQRYWAQTCSDEAAPLARGVAVIPKTRGKSCSHGAVSV